MKRSISFKSDIDSELDDGPEPCVLEAYFMHIDHRIIMFFVSITC